MHVEGLDRALGVERDAFGAVTERHRERTGRPFVTLCWAQTLDGSTTLRRGAPTHLSGPESSSLTHALRAAHRAILVGIGTVLADDPILTVRHAPGPSPRPVILDTGLRLPPAARLVREHREPWVYTAQPVDALRRAALEALAVSLRVVPRGDAGHLDLGAVLDDLGAAGITSLMVEGGAVVITEFLRERLADRVAITMAPLFAGGYPAVASLGATDVGVLPRLYRTCCVKIGDDHMVAGSLRP